MASLEKLLTFPFSSVYHLALSLATTVLFCVRGGVLHRIVERVSFDTEDLDLDPNFVIYCGQTTLTVCSLVLYL